MKRIVTVIACVVFFSVACRSTPPPSPVQTTFLIEAPFDRTWSAVTEAAAETSLPISAIEKESGLMTTGFVTLFRGRGMERELWRVAQRRRVLLGLWDQGRFTMNMFVKSIDDERSSLTVNVHLEGYEWNVSKSWYSLESNGSIEGDFVRLVKSKL
ncbi:MAG: hypothetical protein RX318_03840 [bacterium]|nr:hypothetical protein [bacterium]